MTREEAIRCLEICKKYIDKIRASEGVEVSKEVCMALDMAVKSLKAWDDLLQWLDMIKPKTYPRTKGWIDCIKQIYREHMER